MTAKINKKIIIEEFTYQYFLKLLFKS